jgi:thiol-disulfide isomerase/thioredoxin
MKTSVRRLATTIATITLSCSLLQNAAANQDWYQSYEEALAAAKREGKPIFADFSTTWCHNCKQLERETLSDPNIGARLDNFIKVHIDGDQRPDIVQRFGVDAYPTLVTLDPTGRVVDKSIGFVKPPQLAGTLDNQMQALAPVLQQMQAQKAQPAVTPKAGKAAANSKELASLDAGARANTGTDAFAAEPAGRNSSRAQMQPGKLPATASDAAISKPVLDSTDVVSPKAAQSSLVANREVPLSKAEQRFQSLQSGSRNVYASGSQPRTVSAAKPATGSEITPLLNRSHSGSPGGGDTRSRSDELVVSQAEPRTTPESAVVPAGAEEELPKPLLNAGNRGTAKAASGTEKEKASATPATKSSAAAKATPAATKEQPSEKSTKDTASKDAAASSEEDDPMSTIRKLQKSTRSGAKTTEKATAVKSETASEETKAAAKSGAAASTESEKTAGATESTGKPATESAAATEGEATPKAGEVTAGDIERWSKDADSKLLSGRKKEARAMYQKVYEKDPKNQFGKSDMAFIKMVSLMVDQDDDALRQKALNKIKEFEALFPDSEHKDYYTLIRATLAADLGDTNAAHRLLETFADRFPDSKYQKLAYDTWKSLPPVKKDTKVASSKDSSSSKKSSSSDKKKKAED